MTNEMDNVPFSETHQPGNSQADDSQPGNNQTPPDTQAGNNQTPPDTQAIGSRLDVGFTPPAPVAPAAWQATYPAAANYPHQAHPVQPYAAQSEPVQPGFMPPPAFEPAHLSDYSSPAGWGPGSVPSVTAPYGAADSLQADEHRSAGRGGLVLAATLCAALVGGGVGAGTVAIFDHRDNKAALSQSAGLSSTTATAQNTVKVDGTIGAAAAKIQPSVVTINVSGSTGSGTGSGVVVRSDGYILTNNHVVSVAGTGGSISVVTDSGQQVPATIIGTDPSDDLAVIKVAGVSGLTAATFAKSADVKVGQAVVAVGAPLGLSNTVTSGIISNTARPVRAGDNNAAVFQAVQTDAAINPGNSGGPLVDLNGNVVGINAAIATAGSGGLSIPGQTQQSGSIGIGFAIPADEASRIGGELITTGSATHAIVGVQVNGAGAATGVGTTNQAVGATIATVTSGGPAAAAGLQVGDVVTAVGSQRIADADAMIAAIRSHAPGETITLTFSRGGAPQSVKVTLGSSDK